DAFGLVPRLQPLRNSRDLRLTVRAPVSQEQDDLGVAVGCDRDRFAVEGLASDRGSSHADGVVAGRLTREDRDGITFDCDLAELGAGLAPAGDGGYGDGDDQGEAEDTTEDVQEQFVVHFMSRWVGRRQ